VTKPIEPPKNSHKFIEVIDLSASPVEVLESIEERTVEVTPRGEVSDFDPNVGGNFEKHKKSLRN